MGNVFLPSLHLCHVARQLFVLPAQPRQVRAKNLNLIRQLKNAAAQLGVVVVGFFKVVAVAPELFNITLLLNIDFLPQIKNRLSGFVIIKKRRLGCRTS